MTNSNSGIFEELGYKANDLGFFKEWREKTSSLLIENEKLEPTDAGQKAFNDLFGSR